jgi:uncharacterized protein (TIGR03437 family)
LPTGLAGVVVSAKGQPIPLLFVSPQQINAFLPQGLAGLVPLQVSNSQGGDSSNLVLAPAVPSVFSLDNSGKGEAAALHAGTAQRVTTANPATAGEYVSLFLTGLGATYQSGGLFFASAPVSVSLSNTSAPVTFAGLAPGFVGLYQVNFQIPPSAPHGSAIPLVVTSGQYFSSPQISIAIR